MYTFKISPDNGEPFEARATSRDIVMWEKTGKGRSITKLGEDPQMTEMYVIAFYASRRLGLFGGTIQEFESSVDLDFDVEPPDPTPEVR